MRIEVNIEKRHAFLIIGAVALLAISVGVNATWDSAKQMFHSADDVRVEVGGQDYSLQEVVDSGGLGGSFAFSNTGDTSLSFTAPSSGKVMIMAKGNFGDDSTKTCGGGNYAGTIYLKMNGMEKDSAYKYVHNNHCGSRTFTLLATAGVSAGEDYEILLDGYSSSYQSIVVTSV